MHPRCLIVVFAVLLLNIVLRLQELHWTQLALLCVHRDGVPLTLRAPFPVTSPLSDSDICHAPPERHARIMGG